MLQYATKKDLKEAACIEFRRKREEERKCRIFNPRTRLIGVDREALEQQLLEKNLQQEHETEIQRQYDNELQRRNYDLNNELNAMARERYKSACELNEFRSKCQRREQSREFDLNDPHYVRNCLLGRDIATGAQLKLSNSLTFMGDDDGEERSRQQKQQQRAWLQQQIQERNRLKTEFERANQVMDEALKAHDDRIRDIDDAEKQMRRDFKQHTVEFNVQLARDQQEKRKQRKREDDEDDMAQIINMLTSDMLTENKEMGKISNFGPGRKVISQYRGLTDEEERQIRNEQKKQIAEKIERDNCTKQTDEQFDRILASQVNNTLQQERELNRRRQELADQIKRENERLSDEQKQMQNVCYSCDPNEAFFAQFNTTTR